MVEPLSPELRGGGGVSFEDAVAAVYLAALLTETSSPGLKNGRITKVALQGAASGEPMDDVIVHADLPDQSSAKLALQVKRELVISAAATNTDFRAVIQGAIETIGRDGFRPDVDQVGVVTGTVSAAAKHAFIFVCEFARGSDTFEDFRSRLFKPGFADANRKGVFNHVAEILSEGGRAEPERAAFTLLRHMVLIEMDLLHPGATGDVVTINSLAGSLRPEAAGSAPELWNRLKGIAREGATVATLYTRTALLHRLGGQFRLLGATSFRRTLDLVQEEARRAALQIPDQIGGHSYPRQAPLAEATSSAAVATFLVGLPGSGVVAESLRVVGHEPEDDGG